MKNKALFLLFFFCLTSCGGLRPAKDREREPPKDTGTGIDEFEDLPDLTEIDISEDKKDFLAALGGSLVECASYKKHTCRVRVGLGDYDPRNMALNCLIESIDSNLRPLCETEQKYKRALKYYKNKGDEDKVAEIETSLESIEEEKFSLTEEFYSMADDIADYEDYGIEEIDERRENKKAEGKYDAWERIGRVASRFVVKDTFRAFTRCVDKRARQVCTTIDLDRFSEPKGRKR